MGVGPLCVPLIPTIRDTRPSAAKTQVYFVWLSHSLYRNALNLSRNVSRRPTCRTGYDLTPPARSRYVVAVRRTSTAQSTAQGRAVSLVGQRRRRDRRAPQGRVRR